MLIITDDNIALKIEETYFISTKEAFDLIIKNKNDTIEDTTVPIASPIKESFNTKAKIYPDIPSETTPIK
ncbi:MAG: hypothetical protein ABWJ98_05960 [Hydrogenothermaceae bacterium]